MPIFKYSMQSNNKTIAKNTLFLYFRMMFTMVISLFTSRIILQKLGVDDYGIYQAVGGVVGFLSFINGALSTGSSRFLTYALGEGNVEKLKRTFSTTLNIHILIAILIVIVAETVGLWFLYNKMVIAPDRLSAAVYTYHLSILTAVFTLTQVPYNATIVAHEKMSIYAYMSIFEVSAKLLICYLLTIGGGDRLMMYATLLLGVQVGVMCFYRFYCTRHFEEARFSFSFDKKIFKEIAGFSGWSMFANASIALNSQGVLILLNIFFTPAVVAARAISLQVNMAANQFVSNFRQAANPQIVKKYAAGDYEGSKHLLLESTKYSYYMMYLIALPVCLLAYPLLKLWLGVVPNYTVPFLQLVIVQSLFQVFDTSFYTALYAKGRLRENALTSPTLGFMIFPITYVLFKLGYSPLVLSWTSLVVYAILGIIVKPWLIIKIVDYKCSEIWSVYRSCLVVTLVSLPVPIIIYRLLDTSELLNFIIVGFVCLLSIGITVFFFGIDIAMRKKVVGAVMKKIKIKC
jgi:O-antigen/teichoic acid export membrane protein